MNILLVVVALFLIAHGLIHLSYASPAPTSGQAQWPFRLDHSWLLGPLGLDGWARPLGILLAIVTAIGFGLAGLGLFGIPLLSESWRILTLVSAGASLALLLLFWNRMLVVGIVIDALLIVALLWERSPLANLAQS